ncbi:MAG: AbiJ-NTD4 domain-containing protein [Candidatus Hodarchaeota archaeon]
MSRFSERFGFTPEKVIQRDSMTQELRNKLWNLVYSYCGLVHISMYRGESRVPRRIWVNFFHETVDDYRADGGQDFVEYFRNFFFSNEWHKIYDLVEYIGANFNFTRDDKPFILALNELLEEEKSAYAFHDGKLIAITNEEEIAEIEQAMDTNNVNPGIPLHLNRALELLSQRPNPDFRNSIKESISAVETICRQITSQPRVTLGNALGRLEREGGIQIHRALRNSFNSLYGYTSDEDGIRHSMMDEPDLDMEDARYFLITCSAFINYLKAKCVKSGISLS